MLCSSSCFQVAFLGLEDSQELERVKILAKEVKHIYFINLRRQPFNLVYVTHDRSVSKNEMNLRIPLCSIFVMSGV